MNWSLVTGHWSLVTGHWSQVTGHWAGVVEVDKYMKLLRGTWMRLTCVVFLLFSCFGQASEFQSGVITKLMIDKNHGNKVFIQLNAPQSDTVQCHQSTWHFVLSLNDAISENLFAMLLTIHASGKAARFVGGGQCDLHQGIETLTRLEMK